MQIGKGRHSRPEVCCSPLSSWVRSSGMTCARVQPKPAGRQGQGPGVVGGEVGKVDLHSRVGERHGLAVRSDDAAARYEPARGEGARAVGLHVPVVVDDVEEGLQPGLDSGIGGVGVDLEDQVGFRSHL